MFVQLLIIVVLTVVNAFFAAAEMAMVSMDKAKIESLAESGRKDAKKLLKVSANPNKFLSTIQVGITLAGFFSSASAATGLSAGFGVWLDDQGIPFGSQVAIIIVTLILSYFILVFGELFPKRIALIHAEDIALKSVGPISMIGKGTAPFVKILTLSINGLMKLFKIKVEEEDVRLTEERIRLLIHRSVKEGSIKPVEEERIQKIFEFDDLTVKDVMIPLSKAYTVDINRSPRDLIEEMVAEKHSRIPVYDGPSHKFIGILLLKDVFEAYSNHENVDLRPLMIKPLIVSDSFSIDKLFNLLQRVKKHMVLVQNDHKQVIGIVTLEDMVEEVFGEIEDEFD